MIFPASLHFRLPVEVRPSTIPEAGRGAFALADAAAGTFLGMDFLTRKWALRPEDVPDLPPERRAYAWRHIDDICISASPSSEQSPADFLNHSFEPNILWHLGHYFALRDISTDDELFVDYRHLQDPSWGDFLNDSVSGEGVSGWDWREALRRGSLHLAVLMREQD